jgi:uncharacterized membrane protein
MAAAPDVQAGSPTRPPRRPYIDWLRGVAVLVMLLAHTTDAWTRVADRGTWAYGWLVKIAGMGAPLFLFLAGLSVALGAGARAARVGERAAARSVIRRGLEIFGLAFLFRLQSFALSPGASPAGLLKVDILNIMGPGIALAAWLWALGRTLRGRLLLLGGVTAAFTLLTPPLRAASWPAALPDVLEWYLRPPQGRSWFTLFPWAGLLVGGAVVGVLLDSARDPRRERRMVVALTAGGVAVWLVSWAGSHYPSIYANASFWTTAPSYYFLRLGMMTAAIGAAYLWMQRPTARRFSPMLVFGHTSLFVYWIHVEMVYGALTRPLARKLPLAWALVAFVLFTIAMLGLALLKNRVVAAWKARRAAQESANSPGSRPAFTLRSRSSR